MKPVISPWAGMGTCLLPRQQDNLRLWWPAERDLGYDLNGNMTSVAGPLGSWTLAYDYANRLTSASFPGDTDSFTWSARSRAGTQMKPWLVTAALLAALFVGVAWAGAKATRVSVNGMPLGGDMIVRNGVAYVPLRAVAEALNCTVSWDRVRVLGARRTVLGGS